MTVSGFGHHHVLAKMGREGTRRLQAEKSAQRVIVVWVVTFSAALLTNSFSDASREAEDPCADRPFKRWGKEMMHLFETSVTVAMPRYLSTVDEVSKAERLQILEEKLPKVNPCAYRIVKESQTVQDPELCRHLLPTVDKCDDEDNECAEDVLEQMVGLLECIELSVSYHSMGVASSIREESVAAHMSLTVKMLREKLTILVKAEHLLNMEQKTRLFEQIRRVVKLYAYHNEFSYPVTFSGAICEKGLRTKNYSKRLETAGSDVGELLRHFFAQSKDEQRWCATDEAMWEADNCSADIQKEYEKRQDPGDCTAYFNAATGGCVKDTDEGEGAFDFGQCAEALEAMRNGMECYLTRLARDAASGFTTYDDDKMFGGLWSFEEEYNKCVSGGWLTDLEEVAAAKKGDPDVVQRLREVYIMYKRLDALATFGC